MSIPKAPAIPIWNAMVVGGCGFLGHHIVEELLQDKSCHLISVMCRAPFKNRYPGVNYYICDITSAEQVKKVMEQVKPHVIFNTASPHAYVDHEHAYEYLAVNVDGNRNLLQSAAAVKTVKAYVYTSSAPIIAGPGGEYDHADETEVTLATTRVGDSYHVAKALGDELVLQANRRNEIRTCCIRPTALYGKGDEQMMVPTIDAMKKGLTFMWMGYNKNYMDVVYVGHVARAHLLAAYGLLAGITDENAPKVDGEAFNITDDSPAHPWDFFGMYWAAAGAKPARIVIKVPPSIVLLMASIAEFCAWATSFGKRRPEFIKKERMEFVIYTRTYTINKIRERLGFVPWVEQPYKNQKEAVEAAVKDYLEWPEHPFKLITHTGANSRVDIPRNHYAIENARLMALTHNTMFRALNAIYAQALKVRPGSQDADSLLSYCSAVYDFIHHHHVSEDKYYFQAIEKACGIPGLMNREVEEHKALELGLERFRTFAETTFAEDYCGLHLQNILDSFAVAFTSHMFSEITVILDLHRVIDSKSLKQLYTRMYEIAGRDSNIFRTGPLVFGCQDRTFHLDGQQITFPRVACCGAFPSIVPFIMDWTLAGRHRDLWRFNPSNLYGQPRKPGLASKPSCLMEKIGWKSTLCLVVLPALFTYFRQCIPFGFLHPWVAIRHIVWDNPVWTDL